MASISPTAQLKRRKRACHVTLFSLGEWGTGLIYLPNITQTSRDNAGREEGERSEAAKPISAH